MYWFLEDFFLILMTAAHLVALPLCLLHFRNSPSLLSPQGGERLVLRDGSVERGEQKSRLVGRVPVVLTDLWMSRF